MQWGRRPADRVIDLSLDLVDELNTWRAERKPASVDEFVFATDSGRPRDKDSVRERALVPVVNRVSETRRQRGIAPLPKDHAARSAAYVHQSDARSRRASAVRDGPGRPRRLEDDA